MGILDDLLKVYKKSKIKVKSPKELNKKVLSFGDIIEIYEPEFAIAVYIEDNTAILMSNFWEFATNSDMFVDVSHPIADKWIIELDKRIFLDNAKYSHYGKLNENDINLLKKALDGEELPPSKTGPKVPFNPKDARYKFKFEELKKTLKFNKNLFFEKDTNVIHFNFSKDLFEKEKKAAFDEKKLFEKNGVNILINPKNIIIDTTDKNIGKFAKIYIKSKGEEIVLFEGKIEAPTFEIISKTPIKNPYAIEQMLQIEIYDDKP
ncbi:MAG: hypothetical protein ACP5GK_07845 [Desulfurella sp.]|uniref:hypothetical protein n=3 Tax=Desulfurella sp. TaxID=1962857 RepID=UPI003D0BC852